MSTRSRVKRQVKRNMREHPKVRRRREADARRMRWLARAPSLCDIHFATAATYVNTLADAMTEALLGKASCVVLRYDSPGSSAELFEQMRRQLDRDIARAILGGHVDHIPTGHVAN